MCCESRCLGPATMCLTLYLGYALTGELFHSSRCCMLRLEPGYQKHDTDFFWQPFWGKDWWIFELVSQTLSPTSFVSIITQDHIWKVAGYEAMQKKTNTPDDFSFDKCPRALMFERARHLKESWQSCDVSFLPSNQGGLRARIGGNGWFLNPTINSMCSSFMAWGSICEFPSNIYCVYGDDGEDDDSTLLSFLITQLLLLISINIPLLWFMIIVVNNHDSWWIGLNGDLCNPFTSMWRWPPHT